MMVSNKEYAVIFVDVEEFNSYNHDLICKFVTNYYTPQEGDRVAMFKLGWKSVKDYILFEWAPTGLPDTLEHHVVFEKNDLPHNTSELYQICYISSENVLHGASLPIKFQSDIFTKRNIFLDSSKLSEDKIPILLSSCEDIMRVRRIKKENEMNSGKTKVINRMSTSFTENETNIHKECKEQISDLKKQIEILTRTVAAQQNQINSLRSKREGFQINFYQTEKRNSCKELNFDLGELDAIPPFPLDL